MTRRRLRRRWIIAAVSAVALLAATVAAAWVRRTAPPWPAVASIPYDIHLAADGCPIVAERADFVDSPGQLVPTGPSEVVLCTVPTEPGTLGSDQPRLRVLRLGVDDFVLLINALPDRNEAWRQWQRQHSGWWPDAAPAAPMGEVCNSMRYSHTYSLVLRYPGRQPVALTLSQQCGSVTSGARTRMDNSRPHVLDEFLRLYSGQLQR